MTGFICRGDLDNSWCVASPEALHDRSHHYYFLPEAKVDDLSAREVAPPFPPWARHRLTVPSGRKRYVPASAINGMSSWSGGDLFVSEKAMERLQPHLEGECEFLPAEIDGVPEPYYLMWITKLVDALDREKSTMQAVSWTEPDGTRLKRIHDVVFHKDRLAGRLLFRLPGKGFSEDCLSNFCTEDFVELVTKLQIDGFTFSTGRSGKLLVPVPVR
jgi:hypothetical protein